jgi:hypothetical protein
MSPSPIALFVYKRPEHTLRVLTALQKNPQAAASTLFVFCDGPREGAGQEERDAIQRVRDIAGAQPWCGDVRLVTRRENMGLAASIVDGVTRVVGEYGKIIVLEDDLVTSPGFLAYCNAALELYADDERVMHIAGYMYPQLRLPFTQRLPDTFFSTFMSCWGWATWKRAWEHFNPSAASLLDSIRSAHAMTRFDLDGNTRSMSFQLEKNASGALRTWAIKWYASIFLADGLCLFPGRSLVRNIGNDGTGTHTDRTDIYGQQSITNALAVRRLPLEVSPEGEARIRYFLRFLEKRKSLGEKLTEKLHLLR